MSRRLALRLLCLVWLLAACSTRAPVEPADGPPLERRDVALIRDAVPRDEPRTTAGNKSPYQVLGRTYHVLDDSRGYVARGIASWYGRKFHGRRTSNGEVYDMWAMTAAHKELPIPSYLQVTNLDNQRSVVVRVNDRGPFHDDRIIDLSYAAAVKLGFADRGTARVEIRAVEPDPAPLQARPVPGVSAAPAASKQDPVGHWYLQLGAYSQLAGAERERLRLQGLVAQPVRIMRSPQTGYFRVRIGPLLSSDALPQLRQTLGDAVFDNAIVIRESGSTEWYNPQPSSN